jgi:hypothetical protein
MVFAKEMISVAMCRVNRRQVLACCSDPLNERSVLFQSDERIDQYSITLT